VSPPSGDQQPAPRRRGRSLDSGRVRPRHGVGGRARAAPPREARCG
jgi:hypothetical protein